VAWKTALVYAALSARNAGQPRSRAIGGELVDVAAHIDLYMIAFGRCIDAVSGQIESQILGIHAGIIEGRDCGLQI